MKKEKSLAYETYESLHKAHAQQLHGSDAAVHVRDHFLNSGRGVYAQVAYHHILRIEDSCTGMSI